MSYNSGMASAKMQPRDIYEVNFDRMQARVGMETLR